MGADGADVFRDINPHRWELSGGNPVRFLSDLWPSTQDAVERNPELRARIDALAAEVDDDLAAPTRTRPGVDGPVAFFCAEFGFHASMPIYSGGLGVLAGDILKEASDQALPMIGIGLLYRRGYFRQRLDLAGRQQEYWLDQRPEEPADGPRLGARRRRRCCSRCRCSARRSRFQVWRVDVGRVPLLLLDAELPENDAVQRWTSARLYEGNRAVRLAQYGLLGIGGARVLQALGIEPGRDPSERGSSRAGRARARRRRDRARRPARGGVRDVRAEVVFTTHTPVAAGNETYAPDEFLPAFADLARAARARRRGVPRSLPRRARRARPAGMTPLAIRMSRRRNGVSRLHGEVSRRMWQPLFPELGRVADHPRHERRARPDVRLGADPASCSSAISATPGSATRDGARTGKASARSRTPSSGPPAARHAGSSSTTSASKCGQDSLLRGEQLDYVRRIELSLDPDALTIGFARRLRDLQALPPAELRRRARPPASSPASIRRSS